jgi:multidrug efflux pump subunit AcrA (membrane-fusion protein)
VNIRASIQKLIAKWREIKAGLSRRALRGITAGAVLGVLLILGAVLFNIYRSLPAAAYILRQTTLRQTVQAEGMVEAGEKREIYAPSSLKVQRLLVEEGSRVKAGDLLAVLDTETLELEIRRGELNLQNAEANLTSEQRSLSNSVTNARNAQASAALSLQTARRELDSLLAQQGSEGAVVAAKANLDYARRTWENYQALASAEGVSREALTQAQEAYHKAEAAYADALQGAEDNLALARENLEAAEIRLQNADAALQDATARNTDPAAIALELQRLALDEKKLKLRDANMTAPISGRVTYLAAKTGVPASGLLFVIEDDQNLLVRARIEESDMEGLTPGLPCLIRATGSGREYAGQVLWVAGAAERDGAGEFSAVTGDEVFFSVKVGIDDPDGELLIGMNAETEFLLAQRENCYGVPQDLVVESQGQAYVFTRIGFFLTPIPVETGLETGKLTEISGDSLREGLPLYKKQG